MANDVVIRAEGLGKKYMIGHRSGERYTALRDVLARAAKHLARSTRDVLRGNALIVGDELEEFWALRDLNFEIKRGDVVGVIGRNGAGKSTLLKLLSRITEPTEGRVTINGRVASLLEVGTGFHPELSGRENIYLNGAVLGMTRAEIHRKFDEIVEFSGVERFLDTPVKRYSSGMYVRLAFAVAAHLEPEILIVDEVLAVGDAEFQKKCLGKMKDVANHGRTVLFVSHNIGAIQRLCSSGILLADGRISVAGPLAETLNIYRTAGIDQSSEIKNETSRFIAITKIQLSEDGNSIVCATSIEAKEKCEISIHLHLKDANGGYVLIGSASGYGIKGVDCMPGQAKTIGNSLSLNGLASGQYSIAVQVYDERSSTGSTSRSEYSLAFEGIPIEGATNILKQSWGIGSFHVRLGGELIAED